MVGTLLAAVMAGGMWVVNGSPEATAAELRGPTVTWATCPTYSDDVLIALFGADALERARSLVARLECGTVSAPLDYRSPTGRQITVAISRVRATDRARRLGSLAFNPGGPGASGYFMPIKVALSNESTARLNERYDVIGFDPRGVGYSTKVLCPFPPPPPADLVGPLTEAQARQAYETAATANAACVAQDPEFLGQVNSPNIARDLDRVRAALGERQISYFGVSWGTRLGTIYRSLFPDRVGRMFLDSVLPPIWALDMLDDEQAAAIERGFTRMAAWMAQRNDTYGFGATAEQVQAAVVAVERDLDANPRTFTDLPKPVDGRLVAAASSMLSADWPLGAQVLKELREATGPTAPPAVKQMFGGRGGNGGGPTPPEGMPEPGNRTMEFATVCGDDPARPDFTTMWATFQRRVAANPVTGRGLFLNLRCAGWSVPGESFTIRRTGGSVVLTGPRYETITPYEWTLRTHATVGGVLFTVDDEIHGSVSAVPSCSADLLGYFTTGRIDGGCPGVGGGKTVADTHRG